MGSGTNSFSGQVFSLQRDKNRFVLPPQFRKALKEFNEREEGSRTVMYLAVHDEWDCLIGFGRSYVDDLKDQIAREQDLAAQAGKEFNRQKRAVDVSGYDKVPFDGGGRFTMPDIATLVGIEDRVFYQGGQDFFLIWSPDVLAQMGDDWKRAKDMCKRLGELELAKASRK